MRAFAIVAALGLASAAVVAPDISQINEPKYNPNAHPDLINTYIGDLSKGLVGKDVGNNMTNGGVDKTFTNTSMVIEPIFAS